MRLGAGCRLGVLLGLVLALGGGARAEDVQARYREALAYTVVRTPPDQRVPLPELVLGQNVRIGRVQPFPERRVSDVFWYNRAGMRYGLVHQRTRAPLVFLIAGTGRSFDTDTNQLLARLLYRAGFHVLGFPSPTHPDFIVNASETGVVGRMPDDARDLYRVMRLAFDQVKDGISVAGIYLAGFQPGRHERRLGGAAGRQGRRARFHQGAPPQPVSEFFNSVNRLDAMFDRNVGDSPEASAQLLDRALAAFTPAYAEDTGASLDGDFLFRAYQQHQPGIPALETLIGATFRLSLVNLAFSADLISHGGYTIPPDARLGTTTSLTGFLQHLGRRTFVDYLDGLYLPHFQAREPLLTRERAIAEEGLKPLEPYLARSTKIGLITSRDDIILDAAEVAWLERVFGPRATLFATGGHCGNFQRADFIAAVERFFGAAPS